MKFSCQTKTDFAKNLAQHPTDQIDKKVFEKIDKKVFEKIDKKVFEQKGF